MKRTIASAIQTLDDLSNLSFADRRRFQVEIESAKRQATESAELLMDGRVAAIAEERGAALADLCQVRDAYGDLIQRADLGRITAAECEAELNELRGRQRYAERHLTRTEEALVFVEAVEADPVAYGDSLYEKFPSIRPDFSF